MPRKGRKRAYRRKGLSRREVVSVVRNLSAEKKNIDSQLTLMGIGWNANRFASLNMCSQGNTSYTRDGSKIKLTDMYGKMMFHYNTSAGTPQYVRVMIFRDSQANGALPTMSGLLKDTTIYDSTVSYRNTDFTSRIRTVYDKSFFLSEDNQTRVLNFNKKLNDVISYSGNVGDITDVAGTNYFICFTGDSTINYPLCTYFIRARFIDV